MFDAPEKVFFIAVALQIGAPDFPERVSAGGKVSVSINRGKYDYLQNFINMADMYWAERNVHLDIRKLVADYKLWYAENQH